MRDELNTEKKSLKNLRLGRYCTNFITTNEEIAMNCIRFQQDMGT